MKKTYITVSVLSVVMIVAVIYGLSITGSPFKRMAIKNDQTRISNFTSIGVFINNYFYKENKLPTNLSELAALGSKIKNDPETDKPYDYEIATDTSYKLCATFSASSSDAEKSSSDSYLYDGDGFTTYSKKTYSKGYSCITFEIPASYIKKPAAKIYDVNYPTAVTPPPASKPSLTLSYDGDVFKWGDTTKLGANTQITFKDAKGASILERNAKGVSNTYRPYFTNWKTAYLEMFWDGYYQPISNIVTNPK